MALLVGLEVTVKCLVLSGSCFNLFKRSAQTTKCNGWGRPNFDMGQTSSIYPDLNLHRALVE